MELAQIFQNVFLLCSLSYLRFLLSLSAGIFEEVARFIAMRYFMKQRDWQSGFYLGQDMVVLRQC